ncbi:MAG: hypothetical protein AB7T48_00335 [Solirubrobacterales bacterium]
MFARVVRFTDVDAGRIAEVRDRIEGGEGPPPGVPAKKIQMLLDEGQSTAVVVVFFETEEDMRTGGDALDQMDAGETPGTRVSVDHCEIKVEAEVG